MSIAWGEQGVFGGASGVVAVGHAADAIRAGRARGGRSALPATSSPSRATTQCSIDSCLPCATTSAPHGFGGANGLFALIQREHEFLYGTTREQLGRIAVTLREHALLNPNALFKVPLTLEEYLNARPIAEPLRLYDCVMPCSGAEAVLVVADDIAASLGRPRLRSLGMGERHNAYPERSSSLQGGWDQFAGHLFSDAGLTPADVDLLELYDDYPIMVAIQLEQYGFCETGKAGRFSSASTSRSTAICRSTPAAASCPAASRGAGGGMIGVVEAVQQLQHEAGARQVADARRALVSGFGLVSYGKGLSASGMILERVD